MFFGGKPLWHASVVLWSRLTGQPKKAASWAAEDRARAERIAAQQLAGVGLDDQMRADLMSGGTGLHVRKATTTAEGDAVFRSPRGRIIAARHARGG